jgi:hypothetical protein
MWSDQSGNHNHAVQNSVGSQPLLVSAAINAHPALEFDGEDDRLEISDSGGLNPGSESFLYFAVGQWMSATGGFHAWAGKTSASQGTNWRLFRTHTQKLGLYWGVDGESYPWSAVSVPVGENHVLGWGVDASTGEVLYILNTNIERIPVSVAGMGQNASLMMIGSDETSYHSHMRIAEQVLYRRSSAGFANAELLSIAEYLATSYGL